MPDNATRIEVCVGDVESALAAAAGGADRIELCSALEVGGLTPSGGVISAAMQDHDTPVHVMIRPRAADFCYSAAEFDAMQADIATAQDHNAAGVVFGILRPNGALDTDRTVQLIEMARPLEVTFHRAFDVMRDRNVGLRQLIELGVDRVLSSGGKSSALAGADTLRELIEVAADKILVVPAAGITAENARDVVAATGAKELHAGSACQETRPSAMTFRNDDVPMGTSSKDEYSLRRTDAALVTELIQAVRDR